MTASEFSTIAPSIPAHPGVYKYFNAANELIYVGKAKHLRKRVSSYFSKTLTNYKTAELVRRIHRIEFTIVNSEQDAFFLENSLIKEYQPLFNINLKDDKSYPFIVIKKEPFPRVFFTRKRINDGSVYFGPYTSLHKVRDLLDFIRQSVPLRNCKLNLSASNIEKKKFKVCLEYHLGNCKGPCEGLQSATEYQQGLDRLRDILKGNLSPVLQELKREQKACIENMEFEKAGLFQRKIDYLFEYQARSTVVNTKTGTIDVFSILEEPDIAYVNYLAVSNGSIIQTKTTVLRKKLEETKEELLVFAIGQLRQTFNSDAKEIIVPFAIEYPEEDITVTVPKLGDKKKLLELSEKNVNYFKTELKARQALNLQEKDQLSKLEVLKELQQELHLPELPVHIECFDNSNLHGTNAVAAMVCFKNGEPSKKDYRHFNIKTVEGINDFASMKEVVYRRYKRLIAENSPLPQLIVIDGGKGQLGAALESMRELGLIGKTTLVGLAKNQEELFFAGDSMTTQLNWNSDSLNLIRRIRDEVHRFGITFHRNKRSKAAIENELEKIPGIGKQTVELLLKTFRSVKKIREASFDQLKEIVGSSKAGIVINALKK